MQFRSSFSSFSLFFRYLLSLLCNLWHSWLEQSVLKTDETRLLGVRGELWAFSWLGRPRSISP